MIQEILNKFGEFSDSSVSEIRYFKTDINNNLKKTVEIVINCANKHKDFKYETVKLIFKDVTCFRFYENNKTDIFYIKDILIKVQNEEILFDFSPIDYFDFLQEDPNSNFIITSRDIIYEIL